MEIPPGRVASFVLLRAPILAAAGWLGLAGAFAARAVEGPSPELKIAFIGDQGLSASAQAVLELIRDEGADAVVHAGDFDYLYDPAAWDAQIDAILGADFPYFASSGNHDKGAFLGPGGYQERLEARLDRLRIPWEGDLGIQSSLRYQGIRIVLTTPDEFGAGDGFHDLYIRDRLAEDASIWRISAWHRNMRLMQVGGKGDDTGWGVYEESRRGGAIVATAHEHSYSRTHLLARCATQSVASTSDTLVLAGDDSGTPADEGRSFVFVSGLGGRSIRSQQLDGPWWASIYTSTQGANHGALFGVFHHQGDPRRARFYFKDLDGVVADEFLVESTLGDDPECSDGIDNDDDGETDFPDDAQCRSGSDDRERYTLRSCGLGFEIVLVPALVALRLRRSWKR
jgi:predicted phosphodiesterase